jgi:hypothetical protein
LLLGVGDDTSVLSDQETIIVSGASTGLGQRVLMSAVSLIKYKKFQKLKSIVKLENSPKNYSGEFFCLLASRNLNNNQRAWIFNELNLPVNANLAELGF